MKKNFLALLFNLIIYVLPIYFVVSLYLYYTSLYPKNNIEKSVGCVIGTISEGRGFRSAIVEFNFKGKTYKAKTRDNYVIGEKFFVEFEKNNPSINKVNEDKPVFFKEEWVCLTVGYLDTYNTNYFRSFSSFTYYVDGVKYEKLFEPLENSEIKYPNAKEGYNYMVKYWGHNPQRSIILLDKKTNKSLYNIK